MVHTVMHAIIILIVHEVGSADVFVDILRHCLFVGCFGLWLTSQAVPWTGPVDGSVIDVSPDSLQAASRLLRLISVLCPELLRPLDLSSTE
jgi:hypothetical protein